MEFTLILKWAPSIAEWILGTHLQMMQKVNYSPIFSFTTSRDFSKTSFSNQKR